MKPLRAIYLEWIDANVIAGWVGLADKDLEVSHCKTLGFFVKEDASQIVVACCMSDKECNATIAIPKGWIKRRKWIKI